MKQTKVIGWCEPLGPRWPRCWHKPSVTWKVQLVMINLLNYWNALNELSSGQLIIELFKKEHNQDSMDMFVSQQVHTDLEEYNKWKLVMPR
jgi:hypothetical protein